MVICMILKNVISLIKKYGKESIDLVTGDGGFDYSNLIIVNKK